MRLVVHTFLTLDGVMQGPGGVEEDPSNGFARGGWLVPYADQAMGEIVESWFARTGAVLLGRTTYQVMQPYWSQVTDPDNTTATVLNQGRKYVATNTLTQAGWGDTTIVSGNVLDGIRALKDSSDNTELQVHGSAQLARTLHEAGLVDEYRLLVFPVTVGDGKRLFNTSAPPVGFDVVEHRTTSTGAAYAVLTPKPFDTGHFDVVEGHEA